MSIIEFEIEEIQKLCENVVPNSKIIACTADTPALVRVEIIENITNNTNKKSSDLLKIGNQANSLIENKDQDTFKGNRQVIVCLRFPNDYPNQGILIELKSRTLAEKFLNGLTSLCEAQAKAILGKPQGLHILRFVQKYIHDNPLCVCYEEIQRLKHDLGSESKTDQLKLKQKNSSIILIAKGGAYYYKVKAIIPDDYPRSCVKLEDSESNLPNVLLRYLNGQSKEIARQCVEPPLNADKANKDAFEPIPSLYRSLKFCLEATKDFHNEKCPICLKSVLPSKSEKIITDENKDEYVERVYCGHLYHQGCLKRYMSEPPFPKDGKLCPAKRRHSRSDANNYLARSTMKDTACNASGENVTKCGIRLAHDRWVVNVKIAEARWAQKQARERELQEVLDFLK